MPKVKAIVTPWQPLPGHDGDSGGYSLSLEFQEVGTFHPLEIYPEKPTEGDILTLLGKMGISVGISLEITQGS